MNNNKDKMILLIARSPNAAQEFLIHRLINHIMRKCSFYESCICYTLNSLLRSRVRSGRHYISTICYSIFVLYLINDKNRMRNAI